LFSLRNLLDQDDNAPMVVINGTNDVHVPQHDTLVFQGRHDTEVHLIPDTGHCAVSKLPEVLPFLVRANTGHHSAGSHPGFDSADMLQPMNDRSGPLPRVS
jgi:hypothetical protein